MINNVINAVIKNVDLNASLDTIKQSIKIASDAIGLNYTPSEWNYMITEILYKLEEKRLGACFD